MDKTKSPNSENDGPPAPTNLLRGTGIVGSLTLVSRIFGFIRDLLFARIFGASPIADAFYVAFRIPNMLRSFVAEGALTSAFVPTFSGELHRGHTAAERALRSITSLLLITTATLSIAGIIWAPEIVLFFAPGFSDEHSKLELATLLLRIMMPYIMCTSLVAMLNGALNAVNIFGAAAMAQIVMNFSLIAGTVMAAFFSEHDGIIIAAGWVLIGGILQILIQLPALGRAGFRMIPSREVLTPATKQVLKLLTPALLGAGVTQLALFINTILASFLVSGSISWLFYADRVAQFPIGVFAIALSSVLLPALSGAVASGNESTFQRHFMNSLRFTSFVILPMSLACVALAEPLISVALERGRFTPYDTQQTTLALQLFALGMWGTSCQSLAIKALVARRDTVTPTILGLATLVVNVFCALVFMGPIAHTNPGWFASSVLTLQEWLLASVPTPNLKHAGLALASTVSATISFILSALVIRVRSPHLVWGEFLLSTLKSISASFLMYGAIVFSVQAISSPLLTLVAGTVVGCAAYGAAAALLRTRELHETITAIKRIRGKS